ncbi:MAG: carcinine hydrolase/isopenicillin-N N-acyltransferase family protein, partial [Bacteroidota bacterium]|nr:carcinine hydrolase/isopenicillin-N N-acyltransferase family protein [Bacteroidota bacterium]
MRKQMVIFFVLCGLFIGQEARACSVLYYIDKHTGKIYVVNNEDYWYDVEAYIQINPASRNKLARLWYGWDDFAQGGINEAGLFFDGAVTPEQEIPGGNRGPKRNLGDDILARCCTVDEALDLLEKKDIALSNAHMMIGDSSGNAVVVEWLDGQRKIVQIADKRLIMTNFLLSDTSRGNHPCPRYQSIEKRLDQMEKADQPVDLRTVGNTMAGAVQVPRAIEDERVGGTLYTSFINISDMEFVLVYK